MYNPTVYQQFNNQTDMCEFSYNEKSTVKMDHQIQTLLHHDDAILTDLKNILKNNFDSSHNIISKFNDAATNATIKNSLQQAAINYKFANLPARSISFKKNIEDFYTKYFHLKKYKKNDDSYFVRISWLENDLMSNKNNNQYDYTNKMEIFPDKFSETHLFLIGNEVIFIPSIRNFDLDELRFRAGLFYIYEKLQINMNYEVIKEIVANGEVVRLLGQASSNLLNDPNQKIEIKSDDNNLLISVYSADKNVTYYRFNTKYFLSLFKRIVYSKEVSLSSMLLRSISENDEHTSTVSILIPQ